MRAVLIVLLLFLLLQTSAQTDSVAVRYIQYKVKGFVALNNRERIYFDGVTVDKYNNVVLFQPGPNITNGSYAYKNDVSVMNKRIVPSSEIRKVKVKRQSFASGALVGGAAGFGLGYLGGLISYDYDFTQTDDENDSDKRVQGLVYGLGAAIPTALVGGFAGGIFIKKKFRINGELEKLQTVLHKVAH